MAIQLLWAISLLLLSSPTYAGIPGYYPLKSSAPLHCSEANQLESKRIRCLDAGDDEEERLIGWKGDTYQPGNNGTVG